MEMTTLPIEIMEDVKNTLRAFDNVRVVRSDGKYSVSTCSMLTDAVKPQDYAVLSINKDEIYTREEQIQNYIKEFNCYPYHL